MKDNVANAKADVVRDQPKKDSTGKRVNYDNTRVGKFKKDVKNGKQGRKRPPKPKDPQQEEIDKAKKKSSANDISWYSSNPELLKSAANLPFSTILGLDAFSSGITVPGIMQLPWSPAFSFGNENAILKCFQSMYSFIVHANSRNYKYDDVDLGITVMAGQECFEILQALMRAYGIVKYYEERNNYAPDAYLTAMGFQPADFRKNLSTTWFSLNNMIEQLRNIWIPTTMPIFDRRAWMNSTVFTDAQGPRAQSYIYVRDRYYCFAETLSKTGTALVAMADDGTSYFDPDSTLSTMKVFDPSANQYPVATWLQVAQTMINALLLSQDRGIMYGDLLKAYGADKIRGMAPVPSDYTIAPEYNPEVQMQIENYVGVMGFYPNVFSQDNGSFVTYMEDDSKTGQIGYANNSKQTLLNFHVVDQPSPENIMIATRMTAGSIGSTTRAWFNHATGEWNYKPLPYLGALGTEIPHEPRIYEYNFTSYNGGKDLQIIPASQFYYGTILTPMVPTTISNTLLWMSAFDWHPFMIYMPGTNPLWSYSENAWKNNVTNLDAIYYGGDQDNYALFDWGVIRRMHQVASYSLYGVPHI